MKWLCLVVLATARATILDAQEAIISLPWMMNDEALLPIPHLEEGTSEHLDYVPTKTCPLSFFATLLFGAGFVYHFFMRKFFTAASPKLQQAEDSVTLTNASCDTLTQKISHYFGEVKALIGIWIIPLLASVTFLYDWEASINFLNTRNYIEALFVAVIMTMASSNPIMNLVESLISRIASLFGGSPGAWWISLLTIGPILGCFITEAGAMIVTSLLLAKQFYKRSISQKLAYATLGLLFTHISLGAILTNFCLPVNWMSAELNREAIEVLLMFGWKSVLAIVTSTFCYYLYFRNEFAELAMEEQKIPLNSSDDKGSVPWWITGMHIIFLSSAIFNLYSPFTFIAIALCFFFFHEMTRQYQSRLKLRPFMLVGFFFFGLVIHGGLQEWWITPLLARFDALVLSSASLFLDPFMDGATLTYLATLLPSLSEATKYSVIVGTLAAGGLSMIGAASTSEENKEINPHFSGGISPKKLFLAALFPMFVTASIFFIFRI
ncbi:MAG: hypothetical protein CK425_10670 [Parachlamydia sp.]|nr:MAG: hypothetical protein CK425_10670 [Parachlamydia sp.]